MENSESGQQDMTTSNEELEYERYLAREMEFAKYLAYFAYGFVGIMFLVLVAFGVLTYLDYSGNLYESR